jgi:hypothetical protein
MSVCGVGVLKRQPLPIFTEKLKSLLFHVQLRIEGQTQPRMKGNR